MHAPEIRPRFEHQTLLDPTELNTRLSGLLSQASAPVVGHTQPFYAELRVPPSRRHFWSPQLTITIEVLSDGQSLVRGLFSPAPSIWMLFMFGYAVLGILILFIGITGGAQAALGQPAPSLWVLPLLVLLTLLLYLMSKAGERLGRDQMHQLYDTYRQALGETQAPLAEAEPTTGRSVSTGS